MEKMNQAFEKVRMLVGMEVDDEQPPAEVEDSLMDEFNRNCTLSTKQRLYGFVICLAAGLTCTLLIMVEVRYEEEMKALPNNGTRDFLSLPPWKKAFGCKWVYGVKMNLDGTIAP